LRGRSRLTREVTGWLRGPGPKLRGVSSLESTATARDRMKRLTIFRRLRWTTPLSFVPLENPVMKLGRLLRRVPPFVKPGQPLRRPKAARRQLLLEGLEER